MSHIEYIIYDYYEYAVTGLQSSAIISQRIHVFERCRRSYARQTNIFQVNSIESNMSNHQNVKSRELEEENTGINK